MSSSRFPWSDATSENEEKIRAILKGMEDEVLAFRDEMERIHGARCDDATLAACANGNFDDCSSSYPGQRCMEADELVISACGDGIGGCNALWSESETTVRIHASLAQDPAVVESVCYSRLAEPYMVANYNRGNRNQMYFGSSTGAFRIIPARHDKICGAYDPRRRPWFVAASSGPKDVVLVLDVSGSMGDDGRMDLAKDAARTIVDTLTVADRVAIVVFSDAASQLGGYTSLVRATTENKNLLIEGINGLEADGGTNFYDAFDLTFNALDETLRKESGAKCNIAVLFLTDGQITDEPEREKVINLVNKRTEQIASSYKQETTVFTFSLGIHADHEVTKSIACSTNGIWTPVDDFTGDLVGAMSSYYKLYALGLGEGGNTNFTTWVEPYEFYTAGKMGTSVSSPVFDRSVDPPLFLGVVTVDMYMHDLEQILGEGASSSKALEYHILLSRARCPKIELTELELEALRFLSGGKEAMCGDGDATNVTEFVGIIPEKCPNGILPDDLWGSTEMKGKKYEERACCMVGEDRPSRMCPDPSLNPGGTPSAQPSFLSQPSLFEGNPVDVSTVLPGEPASSPQDTPNNTGLLAGMAVMAAMILLIGVVAVIFYRRGKYTDETTITELRRMATPDPPGVVTKTNPGLRRQNSVDPPGLVTRIDHSEEETDANGGERGGGVQQSHGGRIIARTSGELYSQVALPPRWISDDELGARLSNLSRDSHL